MCVLPSALVEVIESRPAMVENCFSSGVATAEAIVSGWRRAAGADLDGREVDVRQVADRQQPVRHRRRRATVTAHLDAVPPFTT
jgi:hypothetical protein